MLPDSGGLHVMLVVDMSGSMRKNDVHNFDMSGSMRKKDVHNFESAASEKPSKPSRHRNIRSTVAAACAEAERIVSGKAESIASGKKTEAKMASTDKPSRFKYACPDCYFRFPKWGNCLKHMRKQRHCGLPDGSKKGLMQLCIVAEDLIEAALSSQSKKRGKAKKTFSLSPMRAKRIVAAKARIAAWKAARLPKHIASATVGAEIGISRWAAVFDACNKVLYWPCDLVCVCLCVSVCVCVCMYVYVCVCVCVCI